MKSLLICLFALVPFLSASQPDIQLTASDRGVQIESAAGAFILAPGALRLSEKDVPGARPDVTLEGNNTVVASYPGGAELRMVVERDSIDCSLTGVPENAWGFLLSMAIPTPFRSGGQFSFAKLPLQQFPEDHQKEMIQQSVSTQFNLMAPSGGGFTMQTANAYAQLLDNKTSFNYVFYFRLGAQEGKETFSFRFGPLDPALAP